MRVAVIGTGIMGAPMARNIARAGHDVAAWNRARAKAEGLHARVADSPAEAVDGAEAVVTMLSDGDAVAAAMDGVTLSRDQMWWQASTVGDLPLLAAVRDQMEKAIAAGHGDHDMAATVEACRGRSS